MTDQSVKSRYTRSGEFDNAVLFLLAGTTAQGDVTAASNGVAPNMVLGFDHDYRATRFPRHNGGRKSAGTGTDHHDVCLPAPSGGDAARAAAKLGATRLPVATDAPATTTFRKKLRREKFADSSISALWNSIYQDNSAGVWPSASPRSGSCRCLESKIQSIR